MPHIPEHFVSLRKWLLNFSCYFIIDCASHHLILRRLNPLFFGEISKKKLLSPSKEHQELSRKKQSLSVNVVWVLWYKFILHIVTKVSGLKFITVITKWRINIFQSQLHHTLPSRSEVGKRFSQRAALTIQELAEGQCLKSYKSCMQYKSLQ